MLGGGVGRHRHRQLHRLARPVADPAQLAHDVVVAERRPAVLAARDGGLVPAVEHRQPDRGHAGQRMLGQLHEQPAHLVEAEADVDPRALGRRRDQLFHRVLVGADRVGAAVDDDLRGVDHFQAERPAIVALALGRRRTGEGVLPADVVPIVDVEGERDHVLAPRQLAEIGIRRRAGAATLRGVELDDDRRRVGGRRHRRVGRDGGNGGDGDRDERERGRYEGTMHWPKIGRPAAGRRIT